ncbi:MAG: hypothetical protein JWM34_2165 [Ilumatobacteraceae bacterium]|nr:hypothetical protein [Ilumatobacteraceae bacterium]
MEVRDQLKTLIDEVLDDDPRTALIAYRRLVDDEIPWIEQRVVALARRENWNWATIARLLGRTRQSVHERFRKAAIAHRPDPHLAKHQYERSFRQITEDIRRRDDDDPIAW